MKHRIIPVKNISRLRTAGDSLIHRAIGMPGIGLIWGPTGYGKSTAAAWFCNQVNGVYVRALAQWSPRAMLMSMARELDIEARRLANAEAMDAIIRRLSETDRPLMVDEADYVVERKLLTDTLRDIHDLSSVPVVLIGMHGIEKRIRGNEQFTGRIAQWVAFEGLDREDARLLADGVCEVEVADDLLAQLHEAASPRGGSGAEVRRLVVGLSQIEGYARSRGLATVAAADWPKGRSFFIGAAVDAGTAGKVTRMGRR